jgi:DNA-directed RNA polymerase beta subunit
MSKVLLTEKVRWEIIKSNIEENGLLQHQIDSFNYFLTHGIDDVVKTSVIEVNENTLFVFLVLIYQNQE